MRKRVGQINGNRHRCKIQILKGLENRNDKRGTAVDTLRTSCRAILVASDLTVNDHNLIRGALFISRHYDEHYAENDECHRQKNGRKDGRNTVRKNGRCKKIVHFFFPF